MRRLSTFALVILTGASTWVGAQATKPPAFEVVSIKPIQPGLAYPNFFVEGDKLRGNHVTAAMTVARAYGIDRRQLVGGPEWINTDRYNIDASAGRRLPLKTDSGHLQEPVAGMLRALLADRFALRVRQETRDMPAYALVWARPNYKPSEKHLRPAKVDCADFEARRYSAKTDTEMKTVFGDCFERTGGELHVKGRPMQRLADKLVGYFDRLVIDETGLSGILDIDLDWIVAPRVPQQAAILVALEEQLGMKLVERMTPLPVVVIERIERPRPN